MFKVKKDGYFNFFEGEGRFYKGNLHTHSTRSDGHVSPEEAVRMYKEKGYDFISLTDHYIYTDMPKLESDDFLVLPGVELAVSDKTTNLFDKDDMHGLRYHFVAIKYDYKTPNFVPHDYRELYNYEFPEGTDIKDAARQIYRYYKDRGNFIVLAHPDWSHAYGTDCEFDDILAMEVYNSHCDRTRYNGHSEYQWDYCLRNGYTMWGFAVDDAHFKTDDFFRGCIMVKSEALSRESITKSIMDGCFYSTMGPQFKELYLKDGIIHVECSPVDRIAMVALNSKSVVLNSKDNTLLTQGEFKLPTRGHTVYVRIVLADEYGRQAWSNPLYIEE